MVLQLYIIQQRVSLVLCKILYLLIYRDKFIIHAQGKWENKDFETDEYGYLPIYRIKLLSTSKRVIPKKLIYVGNFQNLTPPNKEFVMQEGLNIRAVDWKNVEEDILKRYFLYNKKECEIYQREK